MDDQLVQQDLFDPQIIPSRLAITAMRDSGYKNTAYALAELIDNAQQANATTIEVLCFQKQELVQQRMRSRVSEIAVLDNGSGMDALTLRMALQFGNGTRLNDRAGIGRFGMGLPNASISQARRLDVWSWQNGPDNALHTYLDLDDIEAGTMVVVPEARHNPLPANWRSVSENIGKSGTIVVWSELDVNRLTWKSAKSTLANTGRLAGRIYRYFIANNRLSIRLCAYEEGTIVSDEQAVVEDPLYRIPSMKLPAPFNTTPMFREVSETFEEIEYNDRTHRVRVKYTVADQATIDQAGGVDRGRTTYGIHARGNIGVSVLRAGRELMLDQGWCIGYDPRERWWGAEVEFPPALDELFGVTNNKQAATHFAELATVDWRELAQEGDEFRDVVRRLKDEGDPRGWLLGLADSIKRNLEALRDVIKGQAAGTRSTRRTRHNTPDDVTSATNKAWKDRSKERPLEGGEGANTPESLAEIKTDLTENKEYSEADAEDIVTLIKEADLRVIFLESDFPERYQLFSVEVKGSITEVTFNRKHPAFDDIFGTINMVDEDVKTLTHEELVERLVRAINASKIVFAAWARYEREAGVDRAKALQKVRFDWGQIASVFLQPEDEL